MLYRTSTTSPMSCYTRSISSLLSPYMLFFSLLIMSLIDMIQFQTLSITNQHQMPKHHPIFTIMGIFSQVYIRNKMRVNMQNFIIISIPIHFLSVLFPPPQYHTYDQKTDQLVKCGAYSDFFISLPNVGGGENQKGNDGKVIYLFCLLGRHNKKEQ